MDSPTDSSTDTVVEDFVVQKLRKDQPWMKIDAVHEAARACGALIKTKVEES